MYLRNILTRCDISNPPDLPNEKNVFKLGRKKNSPLKENSNKYDPAKTEMDLA
jgi:hypothetical protein